MDGNVKALICWMHRMMDKTGLCGAGLCEALADASGETGADAPSDVMIAVSIAWEADPERAYEFIRESGRHCMRPTRGCIQGKCQHIYNPGSDVELEATDGAERMRRVLAEKAMGWTLGHDTHNKEWWVTHGNYKDAEGAIWRSVSAKWWHPDTDWQQCGMVIEAMRAKGWTWHVTAHTEGDTSVTLTHKESTITWECSARGDNLPEPHARMLAAARALEAADAKP